ncbi:MAG: response regulator [Leptospirales bacterium]|jgi:two-component system chemotaxis response regulator CheY
MQQIKRRGDGQPFRGIICEDKKQEAMKLRQILESRGYEILAIAENGRELMGLLTDEFKNKADFVALDIIMPVLDGYAAFTEIREAKLPVRVIFVSVENSRAVMENVMQLGASGYITKPLDRDIVLEKIDKALSTPAPKWE